MITFGLRGAQFDFLQCILVIGWSEQRSPRLLLAPQERELCAVPPHLHYKSS